MRDAPVMHRTDLTETFQKGALASKNALKVGPLVIFRSFFEKFAILITIFF